MNIKIKNQNNFYIPLIEYAKNFIGIDINPELFDYFSKEKKNNKIEKINLNSIIIENNFKKKKNDIYFEKKFNLHFFYGDCIIENKKRNIVILIFDKNDFKNKKNINIKILW